MENELLVKNKFPLKKINNELQMESERLHYILIFKYIIISNWFLGEDISPKWEALTLYTGCAHTEAECMTNTGATGDDNILSWPSVGGLPIFTEQSLFAHTIVPFII